MTDQGLVADVLTGDQQAFRSLVRKYQALVTHVVYRLVRNETDRQDVCQDVFMKVHSHLEGFQFQSKLSTWVARIAYNTALNHLDKKKVELYDDLTAEHETIEDRPTDLVAPDQAAAIADSASRVRAEIDRLPVLYGTILALYHLEEMSYRDIADVMHMPEGTVKSYLFRARRMLKDRLVAAYSEEDLCR
jgi:RNA polymerase sigma-70 factor (ECF subfamily)